MCGAAGRKDLAVVSEPDVAAGAFETAAVAHEVLVQLENKKKRSTLTISVL